MGQRFTEGVIFERIMYVSRITSDTRRYLAGAYGLMDNVCPRRYLLSNVLHKMQYEG